MKRLLFTVIIFQFFSVCHAMEDECFGLVCETERNPIDLSSIQIVLPNEEVLRNRLDGIGLAGFYEHTSIVTDLADKSKSPNQILETVDGRIDDCKACLKLLSEQRLKCSYQIKDDPELLMHRAILKRDDIVIEILKNHLDILGRLFKEGKIFA